MTVTLADIIENKFPNADLTQQVIIVDRKDGNGPKISKWDSSLGPIPTNAQIQSWIPEVTLLKFRSKAEQLIEEYISNTAKSRGYDSTLSITSYISSTIPQWKAEADTFIAWRDEVWGWAIDQFSRIGSGEIPIPTLDEIKQAIPQITWPS
jgi:hypothetical protein